MNSMLRPSILYAYFNLKENELRQIYQTEEGFLRKIFKTTKGCPISQLYLEIGVAPARFEIQRIRLLYLKYNLEESKGSLLSIFNWMSQQEGIGLQNICRISRNLKLKKHYMKCEK